MINLLQIKDQLVLNEDHEVKLYPMSNAKIGYKLGYLILWEHDNYFIPESQLLPYVHPYSLGLLRYHDWLNTPEAETYKKTVPLFSTWAQTEQIMMEHYENKYKKNHPAYIASENHYKKRLELIEQNKLEYITMNLSKNTVLDVVNFTKSKEYNKSLMKFKIIKSKEVINLTFDEVKKLNAEIHYFSV